MYNMGTNRARGRGAPIDPMLGYALMKAAAERGLHFPPMARALASVRAELDPQQIQAAERLANRFAANPMEVPVPYQLGSTPPRRLRLETMEDLGRGNPILIPCPVLAGTVCGNG
jgi:hypothetical protein